jgi:hypothetical protein
MDLFSARQLSSRLLGALLAAAGGLLLVAASGVLAKRSWAPPIEILAGLAGTFVGATLMTIQVVTGDPDGRIAAWAAIALGSLAIAIVVARACGTHLLPELRRVRFLASALSISAILGIVQYWQTSAYAPTAAPGLSVIPRLAELPQTKISGNSFIPIRMTIEIENTSSSKVGVLASLYRLDGVALESQASAPMDVSPRFGRALAQPQSESPIEISRFVRAHGGAVVAAGTPLPEDSWFEPNQTYTTSRVVYVPSSRKIPLLTLRVDLFVGKGDRLFLRDPNARPKPLPLENGGTGFLAERGVQETSVVHWLTRDDRRVVVGAITADPAERVPALDFYFTKHGTTLNESYDRRLKHDYSVADDFAFTDLALKAGDPNGR